VPGSLVQRLSTELARLPSGRWPAPGGMLRLRRGHLQFLPDVPASGEVQAHD
jgi:hypothetical protein